MFAVHARWLPDGGGVALWVEDARAVGRAREAAPGRAVPTHPFAGPAELLARLLGGIGPGLEWLAGQAAERWLTLTLPGLGGTPVPSPELLGGGARHADCRRDWRVPVLVFEPAQAAQLLGELFDPRWALTSAELPELGRVDVAYGASLRWLTGVHDLAWRLAGAGRVLPGLTWVRGAAHAQWQPAPTAADHREARALAAGCPPVVRGERSADELLVEALAVLTDREVRVALAERPAGLPRLDVDGAGFAERWFAALLAADGRIPPRAPDEELNAPAAELAAELAAWHGAAGTGALRLCLRLVEPLGPDPLDPQGRAVGEHWRVDLLVQAVDEPSLLVPAAELRVGGPAPAALARHTADPRAAYLAELQRAARCCAPLASALREVRPTELRLVEPTELGPEPTELRLDRAGALDFLRTAAPALAAAGFGVLLPGWWQRPPRLGLALTVRPGTPSAVDRATRLDHDALVAFQWQLALDGEPLTAAELADLAAAKRGLVRIRGQWIEADPERIAAAVGFLEREGTGSGPAGPLLRLALDPGALVAGLPIGALRATGVLGDLLQQGDDVPGDGELRLPEAFGATLRPYQERGVAWLRSLTRFGLGAVLADDMGLGKTVQTLALLALEQDAGQDDPVLLVCPMSLVANWRREVVRFAPMLRVHVQHGAGRPTGEALQLAVADADLVITSYGVLQRDAPQLRAIQWRRVIADEAQTVKNGATAQARALRSLPAGHRIALTGTPVENRLSELHAILDFANPGLLGSAAAFRERYAVPVEQHRSEQRIAELRRRTAPFVLRRRKGDPGVAAELPPKQESTVWCPLTAEQAGLYQAVVADLLHRLRGLKGVERKGAVLGAIGRLKQVCNHPAQLLHDRSVVAGRSGKLARLEELLDRSLAAGERTLVFTQYAEFGALLQPHLAARLGTEVLHLHGRLRARRRAELVERFQQDDGPGVFLLSLKAGGTGLNLTAAGQVVHLDRWWNPAVEEQATDRAHRIGQHRTVQVRRFVCAGTVEQRIDEMIDSKRELARSVLPRGERRLTELSTDELRELLTLTEEAIAE
ncbi:DEAD/DEAH box helicase [Kitasatospora sp. RB6PN24]|uniref:DEAD/DEAH box helicase n=1 Tax=Kitasatospora humi TaxID=2893891 RepID=UPI001E3226F9|nr:DEAD/DEAH box helicase [Kitasatospora humi]MCC9307630.1 DEAD/DEAH box helicase [Kitasatospora humi]